MNYTEKLDALEERMKKDNDEVDKNQIEWESYLKTVQQLRYRRGMTSLFIFVFFIVMIFVSHYLKAPGFLYAGWAIILFNAIYDYVCFRRERNKLNAYAENAKDYIERSLHNLADAIELKTCAQRELDSLNNVKDNQHASLN